MCHGMKEKLNRKGKKKKRRGENWERVSKVQVVGAVLSLTHADDDRKKKSVGCLLSSIL